jgi:multicomponent Na+:H+ antiporter subunit D
MLTTATNAADWIIILPVALPLVGAALLLMLWNVREFHWLFAALVTVAVLVAEVDLLLRTLASGPMSMTMGNWLPPFGISFTADVMSSAFALAASAVTLVLLVYLNMDVPSSARRDGIYPLVLLLLAGVRVHSSPATCSTSMSGSR